MFLAKFRKGAQKGLRANPNFKFGNGSYAAVANNYILDFFKFLLKERFVFTNEHTRKYHYQVFLTQLFDILPMNETGPSTC